MGISVSVVIPTKNRPQYLRAALRSIAEQVRAAGGGILVIDDGALVENQTVCEEGGARYIALGEPLGLNAARNRGVRESSGELICFLDDDIVADSDWLAQLLSAASEHPQIAVFAGAIRPRLAKPLRSCKRQEPPITALELGDENVLCEFAWGANMAIRRSAFSDVGNFDEAIGGCGDEEDWQRRYKAAGGSVLYVAKAGVDHVRSSSDSRLSALARASFYRGQFARRYDVVKGTAPPVTSEVRTLLGCSWHALSHICAGGVLQAAHAAGRLKESLRGSSATETPKSPPFLSGESGSVTGRRTASQAIVKDFFQDSTRKLSSEQKRLRKASRALPQRRVLVASVVRDLSSKLAQQIRSELLRSHHDLELLTTSRTDIGKFQNINRLLEETDTDSYDWLLLIDDDIKLPDSFLDDFLFLSETFGFTLAQPAHRAHSHAAWQVTRRRPGSVARRTNFVEIGPVTALKRATFKQLLPFPNLAMGWGLDAHWAAIAREQNWNVGVIDATAIEHLASPVAASYSHEQAVAEATSFLADRPHLNREQMQQTVTTYRSW